MWLGKSQGDSLPPPPLPTAPIGCVSSPSGVCGWATACPSRSLGIPGPSSAGPRRRPPHLSSRVSCGTRQPRTERGQGDTAGNHCSPSPLQAHLPAPWRTEIPLSTCWSLDYGGWTAPHRARRPHTQNLQLVDDQDGPVQETVRSTGTQSSNGGGTSLPGQGPELGLPRSPG